MKREFRDDLFPTGHPTESRYAIETENDEGIHSRHKDTGFGGNESSLPLRTVEEILSEAGEDASWVVEDVLARGALTEFSGLAKKGGKTTFWCHAIAAGARREDHAGFATEPARYLFLTEQGNNFAESLRASGLTEHPEHVKIVQFKDVSTVKWESLIRQAGAEINRLGFDALVVDTFAVFARLKGSEENDAGAVADRMRTLRLVAQQHNIAVVLIRHAGKDGSPRGSSAFEAEADICVILSRPEGRHASTVRRLSGIGRYGEWERNIELVGARYVSLGTDSRVELDKAVRFLRSVLPASPDAGMKKQEMLDKRTGPDQGFSDRTMARALAFLIEQGEAGEKQLSKVRGRPKVYWLVQKLSEVAPSASGGDALIHSRQTSTATSNGVENKGKRTGSVNGSSLVQGGEITIGDLDAQQPKTSKPHAGSNGGSIAPDSTSANTGSASANSSKAGTGDRAQAGRRLTDDEVRRVRNLEREGLSATEARASVIGYPDACTDGGRRIGDA